MTEVLKGSYLAKLLYQGKGMEEAAKIVGITKKLGYIWKDKWNMGSFNGLFLRFDGGRPPHLDGYGKKSLVSVLKRRMTVPLRR